MYFSISPGNGLWVGRLLCLHNIVERAGSEFDKSSQANDLDHDFSLLGEFPWFTTDFSSRPFLFEGRVVGAKRGLVFKEAFVFDEHECFNASRIWSRVQRVASAKRFRQSETGISIK